MSNVNSQATAEALNSVMMILQIQLLQGLERCDTYELIGDEGYINMWTYISELQFAQSYDFAEEVRQAVLAPTLTEARSRMQVICEEYFAKHST